MVRAYGNTFVQYIRQNEICTIPGFQSWFVQNWPDIIVYKFRCMANTFHRTHENYQHRDVNVSMVSISVTSEWHRQA